MQTGLFDCLSDIPVCLNATCLGWTLIPTACSWAQSRQEECSLSHWLAFSSPVWTRSNIRRLNGDFENHYLADVFLYWFCGPCAICQDARELKMIRSLDSAPQPPTPPTVPIHYIPQQFTPGTAVSYMTYPVPPQAMPVPQETVTDILIS